MDQAVLQRIEEGMAYEAARKAPPPGFPQLPKIPGGRYVASEFQTLEREHLWRKAWVYAGHMDEFPAAGSFKMFTRTGSPIFLVRGRDDTVRAFYNTCQHRGGPLVKEDCGKVRSLVCGYHGWSYDFEGKLIGLRDERDFPDFDKSTHKLKQVRCERFGNWLFVSEDPNAEPLLDYLGPVASHFANYEIDNLRLVESESESSMSAHRYHQHSPLGGHGRLGLGRSSQPQRFRRDHGTRSTAAGQVQQSSQVPTGGHGSAMSPPVHTRSWVGHNSTPSGGRPSATHSTNVAPPHWIHKTMDKHYTTYTNTNDHHLGQQLWQDKQQAYNSIWE